MARILVVFYSAYGHVEQMAHAVVVGVCSVVGCVVTLKRVVVLVFLVVVWLVG